MKMHAVLPRRQRRALFLGMAVGVDFGPWLEIKPVPVPSRFAALASWRNSLTEYPFRFATEGVHDEVVLRRSHIIGPRYGELCFQPPLATIEGLTGFLEMSLTLIDHGHNEIDRRHCNV